MSHALYLASREPQVPGLARLLIVVALAYALSPVDLIPDFIPLLGYLDDLILVPILLWLAIRMVPAPVWDRCLETAARTAEQAVPRPRAGPWIVFGTGFLALAVLALLAWYLLG